MAATLEELRTHVVWGRHRVMACTDFSVMRASDIIEYAGTRARYEYLNIVSGEKNEGLSAEDICAVAECFHVTQTIFLTIYSPSGIGNVICCLYQSYEQFEEERSK